MGNRTNNEGGTVMQLGPHAVNMNILFWFVEVCCDGEDKTKI